MSQLFKFCPRCGSGSLRDEERKLLLCPDCDLHLYRNPAVAVAAIITNAEARVLLIRRAKNPAQGKLALPGGFVDFDETAEAALRREVQEELNLKLHSISYLTSYPNHYHYREVTYPVLDLIFHCPVAENETALEVSEVESVCWLRPDEIDLQEIAFESMRTALRQFFVR